MELGWYDIANSAPSPQFKQKGQHMIQCQHCGGQVVPNNGNELKCLQCSRVPNQPVPVFTEDELQQERRATHGVLQRASYSKQTQWD